MARRHGPAECGTIRQSFAADRAPPLLDWIGAPLRGPGMNGPIDSPLAPLPAPSLERRRRPVTMRDVAAAAGGSISPVPSALNKPRPVRADKRERVLKAIADLEYVPNGMAQALRRTRSGILGAILPDLSTPPYG